jgi:tripartite-type tricarboxylate transporter receptor subunit TctC
MHSIHSRKFNYQKSRRKNPRSFQMATLIHRRRLSAALGLFAAGALLATSAEAQEDFYKGKQISLIVGYGTGGGYDVYARHVAKHIGRFIPGHPTVVVQNMPGAGSLRAVNYIYNVAPKDGTAFAMFSSSMPVRSILGGNKSVQFDSLKMTWLGSSSSFEGDAYLLVTRTDAPSKTIEEVRRPDGPLLVIGGSGPGSSSYDIPVVLRDTIGLQYKMVSGYPGSADLFLAMERNEIHARMVNLTGLKAVKPDWLKPGSPYKVLVQFGRKTRVRDLPDVPTARARSMIPPAPLINMVEILEFSAICGASACRGSAEILQRPSAVPTAIRSFWLGQNLTSTSARSDRSKFSMLSRASRKATRSTLIIFASSMLRPSPDEGRAAETRHRVPQVRSVRGYE